MRVVLVLGNQLFHPELLKKRLENDLKNTVVFMREDPGLCTYVKHHQQKILFFLSAMREYAEELKLAGFKVHYEKFSEDKQSFVESFSSFLKAQKAKEVYYYEIEDRFFEEQISKQMAKLGLAAQVFESPMFLTPRPLFQNYLSKNKRPFMKTFYELQRKRLGVLLEKDGSPEGGKWSFDVENRKALPKTIKPVEPQTRGKAPDEAPKTWVSQKFSHHPGKLDHFWLATDRAGAESWFEDFLKDRFKQFGDYEDALAPGHDFVFHSALTPYLNVGLLLPSQIIDQAVKYAKKHKVPLNSLEGFVRQVIGWREFIRGIYQNFGPEQEKRNFFKADRKLTEHWYRGDTGIAPLDEVIRKLLRLGYAHHIERLMVVGSLMLLLEIEPKEGHRWFMEMFIDSSDWVMGPNVYGMALFADGGIFATKPYFCGSNYYKKMGGYSKGDWIDGVDGLYWSFIDQHRQFFMKNLRLSMSVKTLDRMPSEKKNRIFKAAKELKAKLTC